MKKTRYAGEQIKAGGGGYSGGRGDPADGDIEADILPLEDGIRRILRRRVRRLKLLEEENPKRKQLVANLSLDKHILQDVLSKKISDPAPAERARRARLGAHGVSEQSSCLVLGVDRSSVRYQSHRPDRMPLLRRIRNLAAARTRNGYHSISILLRREGWFVNHSRVYQLYRDDGLSLRIKRRRLDVSVANQERQSAAWRRTISGRWTASPMRCSTAGGYVY